MRLWGGRFGDEPDPRMADFTRSIDVDAELERPAIRRVDRKAGREPFGQYADQV